MTVYRVHLDTHSSEHASLGENYRSMEERLQGTSYIAHCNWFFHYGIRTPIVPINSCTIEWIFRRDGVIELESELSITHVVWKPICSLVLHSPDESGDVLLEVTTTNLIEYVALQIRCSRWRREKEDFDALMSPRWGSLIRRTLKKWLSSSTGTNANDIGRWIPPVIPSASRWNQCINSSFSSKDFQAEEVTYLHNMWRNIS